MDKGRADGNGCKCIGFISPRRVFIPAPRSVACRSASCGLKVDDYIARFRDEARVGQSDDKTRTSGIVMGRGNHPQSSDRGCGGGYHWAGYSILEHVAFH
jgi:hypothetical protein